MRRVTAFNFVVHDPDDETNLCFAGTIVKGERLMINRTIFDADVVLPIGCARLPDDVGGAHLSKFVSAVFRCGNDQPVSDAGAAGDGRAGKRRRGGGSKRRVGCLVCRW